MSEIHIQKTGEPDVIAASDGRLTLLAPAVVEQLVGTSETALEQLMRCPWPTALKDQIRVLAPPA